MPPVTIVAAFVSYLLMLAAYFLARHRFFHVPAMISILFFDLGMPVYLYTHRHWWHRLIVKQDIFSFLVWMHFGLIFTMYALEAAQLYTARGIFRGDTDARQEHHAQGMALLLVRGLVIITGSILAD